MANRKPSSILNHQKRFGVKRKFMNLADNYKVFTWQRKNYKFSSLCAINSLMHLFAYEFEVEDSKCQLSEIIQRQTSPRFSKAFNTLQTDGAITKYYLGKI